jgi:hypothetical protein
MLGPAVWGTIMRRVAVFLAFLALLVVSPGMRPILRHR